MPHYYDGIAFDCDATLSALEGIDQLAALAGVADQVSALTGRHLRRTPRPHPPAPARPRHHRAAVP